MGSKYFINSHVLVWGRLFRPTEANINDNNFPYQYAKRVVMMWSYVETRTTTSHYWNVFSIIIGLQLKVRNITTFIVCSQYLYLLQHDNNVNPSQLRINIADNERILSNYNAQTCDYRPLCVLSAWFLVLVIGDGSRGRIYLPVRSSGKIL